MFYNEECRMLFPDFSAKQNWSRRLLPEKENKYNNNINIINMYKYEDSK